MEYQRVNGIFSEYVFLYHKNLVTDIIVSCENVPNEEVCSLVLKKNIYLRGDSVDKEVCAYSYQIKSLQVFVIQNIILFL